VPVCFLGPDEGTLPIGIRIPRSRPHEATERKPGGSGAREGTGLAAESHASLRNGKKARFFEAFGFRAEAWNVLAEALREHAARHDVTTTTETGFGPRYEIDGNLHAPDGRRPRVRVIWQLDHGEVAPRLITAYPAEASDD
jgi:hypothetical protein